MTNHAHTLQIQSLESKVRELEEQSPTAHMLRVEQALEETNRCLRRIVELLEQEITRRQA